MAELFKRLRQELKRDVYNYLATLPPEAAMTDEQIDTIIDLSLEEFGRNLKQAVVKAQGKDPREVPPSVSFQEDNRQRGPL